MHRVMRVNRMTVMNLLKIAPLEWWFTNCSRQARVLMMVEWDSSIDSSLLLWTFLKSLHSIVESCCLWCLQCCLACNLDPEVEIPWCIFPRFFKVQISWHIFSMYFVIRRESNQCPALSLTNSLKSDKYKYRYKDKYLGAHSEAVIARVLTEPGSKESARLPTIGRPTAEEVRIWGGLQREQTWYTSHFLSKRLMF